MVAFVSSTLVVFACVGVVLFVGSRRPVGTYLTWGEAMVAATFLFFTMFVAYGIVPDRFIEWTSSELGWRPDRILVGPGGIFDKALPFTLNWQVIRDVLVSGIYIVFLGGQIALWAKWQKRGQQKPAEIETSAYGRPLVKRP